MVYLSLAAWSCILEIPESLQFLVPRNLFHDVLNIHLMVRWQFVDTLVTRVMPVHVPDEARPVDFADLIMDKITRLIKVNIVYLGCNDLFELSHLANLFNQIVLTQ